MYRIENGAVVACPQNVDNISGFNVYLEALEKKERMDKGLFKDVRVGDVLEPTEDRAADCIYIPSQAEHIDETQQRIEALRNEYRTATRLLCSLAGRAVCDKLEDDEYKDAFAIVIANHPSDAVVISQTMMYCLFQLYRLDGGDAWVKI